MIAKLINNNKLIICIILLVICVSLYLNKDKLLKKKIVQENFDEHTKSPSSSQSNINKIKKQLDLLKKK